MSCLVNAIAPASEYTIAPSLQQDFINKDTGELLAYGIVTFYRDADHLTLKPVYAVSGPPDDPIFTELPNPLILSAIGTFVDPNNDQDIIPYYKPYDEQGNVDLYYITVYSADDQGDPAVLQFTRDHYPTVIEGIEPTENQLESFIPNGQFLLHQDIPSAGLLNGDNFSALIGYGHWEVVVSPTTTSTNYLTFERYNSPIDTPEANPRYACRFRCVDFDAADSRKDVLLAIMDVNFLQGKEVSYGITAYSNDGENHTLEIVTEQVFGVGGSPDVKTVVATFIVTPQIQSFTLNFTIPPTIGKTLGTGNDDYLNLIVLYPTDSIFDISIVDVMAVEGTFASLSYIDQSPEQTKAFALPASFEMPSYDGTDLGKFVQLGSITSPNPKRLAYLYTDLEPRLAKTGMHYAYVGTTAPDGYLLEDAGEYAVQAGGDLTAYVDLWNVILTGSQVGTYEYGTGINGFTNDGGSSGSYGPVLPDDQLYVIWNRFDVVQPAPDAATSGFTFLLIAPVNPNVNRQVYRQTILPGSSITPGSYYRLPVNTTGPQFVQMFWFTVDGVGTQPAPAFNSVVQIDILSTDTALQVKNKIIKYANGLFQVPDLPGRLIRYWNNGSYHDQVQSDLRDPSQNNTASVISPLFISYITGNSTDHIGSYEQAGFVPDPLPTPTNAQNLFFNGIIKT